MDWRKFLIFAVSILAISIVVFNNFTQLLKELFNPAFNFLIWSSLGIIIIGVITYAVINRKMLK